jgi:hypothetical protein
MSQEPINRSPDLKKLRDEGYNVQIRAGHLVVADIPYVNARREVKVGVLVSTLNLAGNIAQTPDTHVVMFAGEHPCDRQGNELAKIKHASARKVVDGDLVVDHSFSSKPEGGYQNYYEKMVTYATILESHAHAINPGITARTFSVVESPEDPVFRYLDTASSRAGITAVTERLALPKVAIVGVGGTGSYVLDLVAKAPVREIHLFDGDRLLQHNAFRSPGAPSVEELRAQPTKAAYWSAKYGNMRRNVIPHEYDITAANVEELGGMSFVFLCIDKGRLKRAIIERLEADGTSFIDVGMGIELVDNSLLGILRVTTSTAKKRDHVHANKRIALGDDDRNDVYDQNIQIADLNALNAALAVVRWKKVFGFYHDREHEHHSTFTIDCNMLLSEDNE